MTTASFYCAYCYKEASSSSSGNSNVKTVFPKCGQCKTRVFCSRDCQKLDWKLGHKIYCGKAGQEGIDFEIREAGDKGYGVFALRDFFKNEKILVERPILQKPYPTPESCAMAALPTNAARERVRQLLPHDGTLYEKAERNDMSCGDNGERGLFLIMSKVNHDCINFFDVSFFRTLLHSPILVSTFCSTVTSFSPHHDDQSPYLHRHSFVFLWQVTDSFLLYPGNSGSISGEPVLFYGSFPSPGPSSTIFGWCSTGVVQLPRHSNCGSS